MATFSLHISAAGAGAGAKYDYLTRSGKYTSKAEELRAFNSKNLPSWASNGRDFWQEAENQERGNQYKEIRFALPAELNWYEQKEIVEHFCEENLRNHAYTWAMHENTGRLSGKPNPHVHIIFCERKIDPARPEPGRDEYFKRSRKNGDKISGGYPKDPTINGKDRKKWLQQVRNSAERLINQAYREAGREERISAKSLKEQGIDHIPTKHLGPRLVSMEQRGITTAPMVEHLTIRRMNKRTDKLKEETKRLEELEKQEREERERERSRSRWEWDNEITR